MAGSSETGHGGQYEKSNRSNRNHTGADAHSLRADAREKAEEKRKDDAYDRAHK